MTQKAFVENGLIKDIGPAMPIYPAHMVMDVPDNAKVNCTWDGTTAAPFGEAPVTGTRLAAAADLVTALTDAQATAITSGKLRDHMILLTRGRPFPEDSPKLARLAAAMGTTPKAWFDAVHGGGGAGA